MTKLAEYKQTMAENRPTSAAVIFISNVAWNIPAKLRICLVWLNLCQI